MKTRRSREAFVERCFWPDIFPPPKGSGGCGHEGITHDKRIEQRRCTKSR
jgi:hypothetical protein